MIPPVWIEAEQALPPAVLEHEHERAVGGRNREQVEHDRLDGDHDRAERDQHQQERERKHEREHVRRRVLELPVGVPLVRRAAGDSDVGVMELAHGRWDDRLSQRFERCQRLGVGAFALHRERDERDRCRRRVVDVGRREELSRRKRLRAAGRRSRLDLRAANVAGLDHHLDCVRAARERLLQLVVRLHRGQVLREACPCPAWAMCSCSAGAASASRSPPAMTTESNGRRRTRSRIALQIRPSPSGRRNLCRNGTRRLVDLVAECGEECRAGRSASRARRLRPRSSSRRQSP